mgnify:CR=1 FL=1
MAVINTNVKALFSQSALQRTEGVMSKAMAQLSTGKRINAAKDDAAGLAITNIKDADMVELWDDKAVRVERNTGKVCEGCANAERRERQLPRVCFGTLDEIAEVSNR